MMNSEFGIRNSECRPPTLKINGERVGNSEFRIRNSEFGA